MRRGQSWGARGVNGAGGLLLALLVVLTCPVAMASAVPSRTFTGTSFGPAGPASQDTFAQPGPIATDPGNGSVYVADTGAGVVYKFDEGGAPTDFSALGAPRLEGFTFLAGAGESQLAVDPTTHALYVLSNGNEGRGSVEAFDPSGEPREFSALGSPEILASTGSEFCGVAVDAVGDLYIGDYYNGVSIYSPIGELIQTVPTGNPCNVAVDAEANLYSGEWEGAVKRYVPSSSPPSSGTTYSSAGTLGGALARTVYADPVAGSVLVDEGDAIAEATTRGGAPRYFAADGQISNSEGVAYSGAGGPAFVSDSATGRVKVFSPPAPLLAEFGSPSVSAVGTREATLEVAVDPKGSAATAFFEYGTAPCVEGGCARTEQENLGSGEAAAAIAARLTTLAPSTTYFFRAVAANGVGVSASEERSFATQGDPVSPPVGCPNEAVRTLLDRRLPDCRAYEMVSPVDKEGADIKALPEVSGAPTALDQSAPDGGSFTYSTFGAFAAPVGNPWDSQYLAVRGGGGWSTINLTPPREGADRSAANEFKFFTQDLSRSWMVHSGGPSLAPGGPSPDPTLYERETASGRYVPVNTVEQSDFVLRTPSTPIEFQGQGGGRTVFRVPVGASRTYRIFEATAGRMTQVSLLPDGTPYPLDSTVGGFAGGGGGGGQYAPKAGAVSADGSDIYWTGRGPNSLTAGPIFVRVDGRETRSVSETAANGNARFWTAATDGSRALFSFVGGEADGELYEYSLAGRSSERICGEFVGLVGGGEDLAIFYFVSLEAIGGQGSAGLPNLYVDDGGRIELVATLSPDDVDDSNPKVPSPVSRVPFLHLAAVSGDGEVVVFNSRGEPTGYDNRDAVTGERDNEVYRYDTVGSRLDCLSCDPTGARPQGRELVISDGLVKGFRSAAQVPAWQTPLMDPGVIAADGARVFFDADGPLLPRDTNGRRDVYEWEEPGVGGCAVGGSDFSPRNGGCLALVSTGTDPLASEFLDADETGGNVFFATGQSLVGSDRGSIDVYDAREFGGFAEPPGAIPACEGDACQASGAATTTPNAGSRVYSGPPNARHKKKRRHRARRRKGHGQGRHSHHRHHRKQGRKGK